MRRIELWIVLACSLALPAYAHDFCAATAAQLQQALSDASSGGPYAGEDSVVRLVQGSYKTGSATGNQPFHLTTGTGNVAIEGGYDAACQQRTPKAALTVLDGNHVTAVLAIDNADASVTLSALTIQNGESAQSGAGLAISSSGQGHAQLFLQGNIFRNNHTMAACGGFIAYVYGHELLLQNNLIVGNAAEQNYGAGCAIGNGDLNLVYNNTVAYNTAVAGGSTGGLYVSGAGGGGILVINNVLRNNSAFGLHIEPTGITFTYNDYGNLDGQTPGVIFGNLQVDPQFADVASEDFRLAGTSLLLGYSPFISGELPGGLDPDGNARPLNGHGDVGAYNETVFVDGFDP